MKQMLPSTPKPHHHIIDTDRTIARAPHVQAAYDAERRRLAEQYGNDAPCPLCQDLAHREAMHELGTMLIITNNFPYASYDGLPVKEHLLLIPKRHVQGFDQFNEQEESDYWHIYKRMSSEGYNTMTRANTNQHRSVPGHVHTHLLRYKS